MNKIELNFNEDETIFYEMLQKYAKEKGLTIEDYIKQNLKAGVAWGHFKRKKKAVKEQRENMYKKS